MLNAGTKLGPYEIQSALGAGGMGEVYRATDTRLDRLVAIKVLPPALAADPEFRERFEREARIISQLNHPHICTLYDVGEAADPIPDPRSLAPETVKFLVMEYLEGESLADRLKRGALPLDQALTFVIQICDALDKAHRHGVVHRDLKPGNVMITKSGAKLLDFGLAKSGSTAARVQADLAAFSAPPTRTTPLTTHGAILGTFQYMAPEQVEGKDADARSDIFAFGAMFYEMTTGRRAFQGKSQISVMAAILEQDPAPASSVVATLPAGVDKVIRRCLSKDPDKRWQCAGDLRSEIEGIAEIVAHPAAEVAEVLAVAAAPVARVLRRRVLVDRGVSLAAGIVLTALAVWGVMRLMPERPPQPVRFAIVPPPAQPLSIFGLDRDIAISPDGTHIVYRAGAGGQGQLVVRAIDRLDAQPLAGITNARAPFLSPDGRWIGFYDTAELKKVSITGGPPITLCRATAFRGASWGSDDTIIFATLDPTSGLLSVPAGGGEPKVLTKPDTAKGESDHLFPAILPGGRAVLFTVTAPGQVENAQVAVLDLTTGERKILIRGGSHAEYVETGHLVYAAAGSLRAVRFDLERLEVVSDPVPVVEQVMTSITGAANFAISRGGTLVFVPGGTAAGSLRSLVWVNRQGKEEPIKAPTRAYTVPRLSPDGTRVALEVRDQENDVWILDLRRENLTRLTFHPNVDQLPIWTPDGRRVIFASSSAGVPNLFWQAADGTGAAERLTTSQNTHLSHSISPDGSRLVLQEQSPKTGSDLMLLMLDAGMGPSTGLVGALRLSSGQAGPSTAARRAEPLIQTTFGEFNPEISPDGRWIAYQSNESGQAQVYVRPFPKVNDGRWQASTAGGTRPAWARNGREVFYLDGSNALTAVPIQSTAATFSVGNPSKVLDARYFTSGLYRNYDVSPDGQRFLMIKDNTSADQTSTSTPASMVVVLNWFEELRARAK